jgi:hypothetical protein
VALIPPGDPTTQVNGQPNVEKTNLERAGVNQPVIDPRTETSRAYCQDLLTAGLKHLILTGGWTAASPESANGVALFVFLMRPLQARTSSSAVAA